MNVSPSGLEVCLAWVPVADATGTDLSPSGLFRPEVRSAVAHRPEGGTSLPAASAAGWEWNLEISPAGDTPALRWDDSPLPCVAFRTGKMFWDRQPVADATGRELSPSGLRLQQ